MPILLVSHILLTYCKYKVVLATMQPKCMSSKV